jgi:indole-3-glycerol phosphate synthase
MTAVVEVHDETALEAVLTFEPRVIAINNRDPLTGEVDLAPRRAWWSACRATSP